MASNPILSNNADPYRDLSESHTNLGLRRVVKRIINNLERDTLVQDTAEHLRETLQVDRIALYYFYRPWKGQVTFEALSTTASSILGSTGADDCFNDTYAALYLQGRVRAIADIEQEPIQECHREFLRSIQVRANLAVPILTPQGLWGLLIAHYCQDAHLWTQAEIEAMQQGATTLATAPMIQNGALA